MNETLEPYVKKLLDGGMKTAEDILRFVETQAPLIGEEIILWGAASEVVDPIIGLFLLVAAFFIHSKLKDDDNYYGSYDCPPIFLFVVVHALIGVCLSLYETVDVIYPLVAPKLYLLEKISSFIK